MPDSRDARLAVLIDADNTSARHAADLLEEIAKYGSPTVKRVYGDWTTQQLVRWKEELHRHAIQPMQQFAYTTGKNSTDSALIIDAMDLLYSGNLDAFAIVSSDSDFTRLATRLRESGATVYGLGQRKTPESFREACDRFIYLEVLGSAAAAEPQVTDEPAPQLPDLPKLLTKAIDSTSQEDGWSTLSAVGSYIGKSHASFDPRHYGFPKLVALARAQDYVEVEQPSSGPVRIRLRSKRADKKAAAKKTTAKKTTGKKATSRRAQSS